MLRDVCYILIHLMLESMDYGLAYIIIFRISLNGKLRRYIIIYGILACVHIILLKKFGIEVSNAVSIVTMVVIPMFYFEVRDKKYFLLYPSIVFGSSVIGVCISYLATILFDISESEIICENGFTLVCEAIETLVLLLVYIYIRICKKEEMEIDLEWRQYLMFYLVVICLYLMIAPMQTFEIGDIVSEDIKFVGFASSLACVILVVESVWQVVVANRDTRLIERNNMNERYIELQKQYYMQMLERDEKMRSFRHDMRAHVTMLKSYCKEGRYKDMENYLNKIIDESAVYMVEVYTGNRQVDAILRQLLADAKDKKIFVEIKGGFSQKMSVSEYDACTIIYNLMKNAIEACEKIENEDKRKIQVKVGNYESYTYISIKNTILKKVKIKNNYFETTKNDKINHGIGSKNVESTVKKYSGKLKYRCDDEWFGVEILV